MPKNFPSFSNQKNALPQILRENWAILEKLQNSANSKQTFHSSQKILQFNLGEQQRKRKILLTVVRSVSSVVWNR